MVTVLNQKTEIKRKDIKVNFFNRGFASQKNHSAWTFQNILAHNAIYLDMPLNTTSTVSGKSYLHHQVGFPSTVGSATGTVLSWCIFVKTLGRGFDNRRGNGDGANSNKNSKVSSVDGSFSFNLTVSPEDRIDFFHDEIEGLTGGDASQQRLIYSGRLIGKSDINSFSRNTTREDGEISSID